MIYAYIRVSTKKQKLDRQRDNIVSYCGKNDIDFNQVKFYQDEYTGTSINRPSWDKLLKRVKEGDTIIFDEVSRMSRNAEDGYRVYTELYNQGVNLVFLKEPHINTDVYRIKLNDCNMDMLGTIEDILLKAISEYRKALVEQQVKLAFETAQKERDFLSQRTKEGIRQSKKQSGPSVGSTYDTKKARESKDKIRELSKAFNGQLSDKKVMDYIGISRPTFYKYKKQMIEEQNTRTGN